MTENHTNSPALSRRTLLTALPATGAALALPAEAEQGQTEILHIFRRYQAIKEASRAYVLTAECDEDEMEKLFYRPLEQLEADMMEMPSTCAADMAAKMIVAHGEGDFSSLPWDDPAWIEARQLVGWQMNPNNMKWF